MSGSRPKSAEERLAEQHLGDRLAALVDGELGHESRERVLAHVATCARCRAEVDAQRRLKNVFAEAAPPPPSASFLARLQGLPGGGDGEGGDPLDERSFLDGIPGGPPGILGPKRGGERFDFDHLSARRPGTLLPAAAAPQRGFRIHEVGRHDADRAAASRGRRRFAFAAAGAVSLAAIALGGVTTGLPGDTTNEARGGNGSNVTPMRTPATGATTTAAESQRRRGAGPLLAQGQQSLDSSVAATEVSAPLLPGGPQDRRVTHPLTAAVEAGAAAMSPLIRPFSATPPLTLAAWLEASDATTSGLLAGQFPGSATPPPPGPSASAR
ncbi:anti-sigma factor family protein [Streptomyces sp. NPDC059477]|uniref:anti-sigma factor family protein n=1 Tax=Streptomyces sp. NPDC059477 TaxID=3346847 RepID=UPI003693E265